MSGSVNMKQPQRPARASDIEAAPIPVPDSLPIALDGSGQLITFGHADSTRAVMRYHVTPNSSGSVVRC